MKLNVYLFIVSLITVGCKGKIDINTNEIISANNGLFGVMSSSGALLIDSIYTKIRIVSDHDKLWLPPKESREQKTISSYYEVHNASNKKAIFNAEGEQVFGFIDATDILYDQHTLTAVVSRQEAPNTKTRKFLYAHNGVLLSNTSYANIAFIKNCDLIVLVEEDAPKEAFYLYNPFTKSMKGPHDHFNIFNEDMSSIGLIEAELQIFQQLNVITIRKEIDNEYFWGMIDSQGNEILPPEYKNIRMFL